jgi:D-glycero-D-manno-heptose 1,7-bisphosphate phosphatase
MRAVFLDRDGVISENRSDHVKSWEEFRFIPGIFTALRWLGEAGFHTFVVTNQAIVNRGIVAADVIEDIHARMLSHITYCGGRIDDVRYCPHDYGENCPCRKPQPGMLMALAAKWRVDLSRSYMIGDAWTDVAAGIAAGCHTIMVRTGRGGEQLELPEAQTYPANHVAADLTAAAEWILTQEGLSLTADKGTTQIARSIGARWNATLRMSR